VRPKTALLRKGWRRICSRHCCDSPISDRLLSHLAPSKNIRTLRNLQVGKLARWEDWLPGRSPTSALRSYRGRKPSPRRPTDSRHLFADFPLPRIRLRWTIPASKAGRQCSARTVCFPGGAENFFAHPQTEAETSTWGRRAIEQVRHRRSRISAIGVSSTAARSRRWAVIAELRPRTALVGWQRPKARWTSEAGRSETG